MGGVKSLCMLYLTKYQPSELAKLLHSKSVARVSSYFFVMFQVFNITHFRE